MALPAQRGGFGDEYSERASSLEDYKVTCIQFVADISRDYLAWVDYYKLDAAEDAARRRGVTSVIGRAEAWISKVAQSVRGVDVVMDDAIQKMAEATAGKPFEIGVFASGERAYAAAPPGVIEVAIRSSARGSRRTRLGSHSKDSRFRLDSTCGARVLGDVPAGADASDLRVRIDASGSSHNDVISFTAIVAEADGDTETERRGSTTLIRITESDSVK